MKIHNLVLGYLDTNCYILEKAGKALIIDPADNAEEIITYCKNFEVVGILVTHFHPDHIGALKELEKYYNLRANQYKGKDFVFEIIKSPGHTDDSISFYFERNKVLFAGDFLFAGTIGRYDFPNSSALDMRKSLAMISEYPDDITVYPGHGPSTILGKEKKHFNDYF